MIKKAEDDEILTLEEVAAYLRVPAESVERMVRDQGLPARNIEGRWRFHKDGLRNWLISANQALLQWAGAFKDDPTLPEVNKIIKQNRRRDNRRKK
jgi:excisionase family DNA binding protein